jgi:hypothetical protein
MAKKPTLKIVKSDSTSIQPPRKLGQHGMALWSTVQNEYSITDTGGIEILAQGCAALDRAEELAAVIDNDGPTIMIRGVLREHPLLKGELANRAFLCRCLQRLGLNFESLKGVGRPPGYSPQ